MLDLDEAQNGFEAAFSGRSPDQIHEQLDVTVSRHTEEFEEACSEQVPGEVCADFCIKYADE